MTRVIVLVIVLLACGAEPPAPGRVARAAEQSAPASTFAPVVENARTAEVLLLALERKDLDAIMLHLAPEVALVLPLAPDGDNTPANVDRFDGRDAVRAALRRNFAAYKRIAFVEPVFTPSADGRVVFVEARGRFDTVHGRPYRNVYLIKLVFDDAGAITRIDEWANPVTASMTWGFPLGTAAVPRFTAIGLAAAFVWSGVSILLAASHNHARHESLSTPIRL